MYHMSLRMVVLKVAFSHMLLYLSIGFLLKTLKCKLLESLTRLSGINVVDNFFFLSFWLLSLEHDFVTIIGLKKAGLTIVGPLITWDLMTRVGVRDQRCHTNILHDQRTCLRSFAKRRCEKWRYIDTNSRCKHARQQREMCSKVLGDREEGPVARKYSHGKFPKLLYFGMIAYCLAMYTPYKDSQYFWMRIKEGWKALPLNALYDWLTWFQRGFQIWLRWSWNYILFQPLY